MDHSSQELTSSRARRWAGAKRPIGTLDNPVKRYLGNRPWWRGLKETHRGIARRWRWIARLAY